MMQITPMVRNLLIMNGVIFVMTTMIFPESVLQFALYNFESSKFRPYQLITHMFLHGGFSHLFMNMFSLFIFGPMLEHHWGSNRFLTFYLITGLGASLLYQGVRGFE
ncbi:MAG TPA: rhomboid family intramembrane serine protease, partial [Adhaeribacter sp.]|nr:rhomboid family intramembrane serine protease [Adhaeribacter sp.]